MPSYLYIAAPARMAKSALEQCRAAAQKLADTLLEPVVMAIVDESAQGAVADALAASGGKGYLLRPVSTVPMGSAPFAWKEDGTPDWSVMWTTFCELALYGGPPHRGTDRAVVAPPSFGSGTPAFDALAEMQRGIETTTGLTADAAEPGWLAVRCGSKKMAAWLCATIILENVDARCDGETLFVPASRDFTLEDEVKSVVTVLAKTHHYYRMHVETDA